MVIQGVAGYFIQQGFDQQNADRVKKNMNFLGH